MRSYRPCQEWWASPAKRTDRPRVSVFRSATSAVAYSVPSAFSALWPIVPLRDAVRRSTLRCSIPNLHCLRMPSRAIWTPMTSRGGWDHAIRWLRHSRPFRQKTNRSLFASIPKPSGLASAKRSSVVTWSTIRCLSTATRAPATTRSWSLSWSPPCRLVRGRNGWRRSTLPECRQGRSIVYPKS